MEVYRIFLALFPALTTSALAGRWNFPGVEIVYTSSSRSLACLENVVHRDSLALTDKFRVTVIELPDVPFKKITAGDLPTGWNFTDEGAYDICRKKGNQWSLAGEQLILEVPSAIIKNENNYLINTNHDDFKKVKIVNVEPFFFDPRIKS
jgi:RES domain-containing protein